MTTAPSTPAPAPDELVEAAKNAATKAAVNGGGSIRTINGERFITGVLSEIVAAVLSAVQPRIEEAARAEEREAIACWLEETATLHSNPTIIHYYKHDAEAIRARAPRDAEQRA